MEKRLPLALFLSFLVLFGWSILNPPEDPPPGQAEGTPPGPSATGSNAGSFPSQGTPAAPSFEPTGEVVEATEERELTILLGTPGEPGYLALTATNRGGGIRRLATGNYFQRVGLTEAEKQDRANWTDLMRPVGPEGISTVSMVWSAADDEVGGPSMRDALWVMEPIGRPATGVEFTYAPGTGLRFTKRIEAVPGKDELHVTLSVTNEDFSDRRDRQFTLTPVEVLPVELGDKFYREPVAVIAGPAGSEEISIDTAEADPTADDLNGPLAVSLPVSFAGAYNKYFAVLLRDAAPGQTTLQGARYRRIADPEWAAAEEVPIERAMRYVVADAQLVLELPAPGETTTWDYAVYAGPKKREVMLEDLADHRAVAEEDLGFFSGIGSVLLAVLGFFESIVGNWGVAIIMLTLLVRAILFPLNRRSQTAMARHAKKMKRIQPLLDESKKKHAKDPQKMRQEQARIMQENGAFPPLGGCLPIFVQIPVFFGLFSALRTSFDLRQAPFFGWVTDLSRPDRLMELDFSFLFFHIEYLNILPILMVILWVTQQRTMPTPADEQAAKMQRMMSFVTIGMGFFLYNYASGLSLYMITQSSLGIFEQKVIKQLWPVDDTELEPKKKKGCGPFSGIMEKMAEQHKEQLKRLQEADRQKQRARAKKGGKRK